MLNFSMKSTRGNSMIDLLKRTQTNCSISLITRELTAVLNGRPVLENLRKSLKMPRRISELNL